MVYMDFCFELTIVDRQFLQDSMHFDSLVILLAIEWRRFLLQITFVYIQKPRGQSENLK